MLKNFAVNLLLYKNMQQEQLGNSDNQNQLNEGFGFFFCNVKQFQEKWSHGLGCLFSVLRKELISKGKLCCPSLWAGHSVIRCLAAAWWLWFGTSNLECSDVFSFDVKEETWDERVRVLNVQRNKPQAEVMYFQRTGRGRFGGAQTRHTAPSFAHPSYSWCTYCLPTVVTQPAFFD